MIVGSFWCAGLQAGLQGCKVARLQFCSVKGMIVGSFWCAGLQARLHAGYIRVCFWVTCLQGYVFLVLGPTACHFEVNFKVSRRA